jgi:hypothetical protein
MIPSQQPLHLKAVEKQEISFLKCRGEHANHYTTDEVQDFKIQTNNIHINTFTLFLQCNFNNLRK